MPVQPLDLQINIAQQIKVARAQQAQQEQLVMQQIGLAHESEEESRIHQTQVHAMEKIEGKRIEEKGVGGRGEGRQMMRERKRKREMEEEEEYIVAKDPNRGRIIDIFR